MIIFWGDGFKRNKLLAEIFTKNDWKEAIRMDNGYARHGKNCTVK